MGETVGERLTRAQGVARRGARTVISAKGIRGVVVETAWVVTHIACYPFGFTREKRRGDSDRYTLADLPPVQRSLFIGNVEAAGTPILLVHGLVDNRSIFALLRRGLRRRGFGRIVGLNYSPFTADIRTAAARLGAQVEKLCEETGYERVHIVGHSLGGLIARYYVQRLGGDARVHTVVCLGTPHAGTRHAQLLPSLLPGGVIRQLRPDSDLIAELASPARGCRTRFLSVWSDLDQLMVPKQTARMTHPDLTVRNVLVRGLGHLSLPIDGRVVHAICTTLAHLDHQGSTVTAGVTAIDAVEAPQPAALAGPPERASGRRLPRPRIRAAARR
ncbi:MAG: triacylglycerol lipase [Frankiales bacterium]|nr:triacylglycerol lipase [Frankiales bacterium]